MNKYGYTLIMSCFLFLSLNAQTITITLHGDSVTKVAVFSPYMEPGYDAKDSLGNDYTQYVVVSPSPNTNIITYNAFIDYSIADSIGQAETKRRIIQVIDTVSPVITLIGGDTVCFHVGDLYVEPGVNVTDNYDSALQIMEQTDLPINSQSKLYIKDSTCYEINYRSRDMSGNSTTVTRYVCGCYSSVGIEAIDMWLNNISLYPNPSSGSINIQLPSRSVQELVIHFVDVTGKDVSDLASINKSDGTVYQIDISKLSKGIYFLGINDQDHYKMMKLIRE